MAQWAMGAESRLFHPKETDQSMTIYRPYYERFVLLCLDICTFYVSLCLAFATRKLLDPFLPYDIAFTLTHFVKMVWIPLLVFLNFFLAKMYVQRKSFWDETHDIVTAISLSFLSILAVVSLGKFSVDVSRVLIILFFFYSLILFPMNRFLLKIGLHWTGVWKEKIIILGAGRTGTSVARGLTKDRYLGYDIVGLLDDDPDKIGTSIVVDGMKSYPVLGPISAFDDHARSFKLSAAVIAMPSMPPDQLSALTSHVQRMLRCVFVVPEIKGVALTNTTLYHIFVEQLFMLRVNNNLQSLSNKFLKFCFDLGLAILLLPFFCVLFACIALAIKLDSKGSVFFTQVRMGKGGAVFNCFKFRTMYTDADQRLCDHLATNPKAKEEFKKYRKLKGRDPRVTRVGHILRKTSLDELPQIINVLVGDMSFVGPRPYMPEERQDMGDYTDIIFETRPGLTGLWQVSGRNLLEFGDRLRLDSWYVLNWSLWLDFVIIMRSVKVVLSMKGAY